MNRHSEVKRVIFEVCLIEMRSVTSCTVQYLILFEGRWSLMVVALSTLHWEQVMLSITQYVWIMVEQHISMAHVGHVLHVLSWRTSSSEETSNITTHVKKCCILIVEAGTLVRNTIIHRMVPQNLPWVASVELILQVYTILREVSLVTLRMPRGPVQIFVTPLVASRDG